ncbi:hypothetical protein TSUD_181990 [Trifolium subterraneum]|uniref:WRKY domain-containing protein n=1 Tax=Trifolium subterraneum TaxID=3900 RepID=A0A2Z6NZS0_TRISU|nr:hypothetical protein TSUD_181990 [Trifolium subterraneum]
MEQHNNNINKSNNNNENKNGFDEIYVSDSKGGDFFDFSPKKSIAERRGFNKNTARINTTRFRIDGFGGTNSSASPTARSPCLTIPPGISPTALLDSPIMLPNSQAMPSPTTGSFAMLPPLIDDGSMLPSITHEQREVDASFKFMPEINLGPNSLSPYLASLNEVSSKCHMMNEAHEDLEMLAQGQQMLDFSVPNDFANNYLDRNRGVHFDNDAKLVDDMFIDVSNVDVPISRSEESSDISTLPEDLIHDEDIRQLLLEEEQKEMSHATSGKTSEDGYNWRKYGQKQVKGSDYPRSYYKCTKSNCQVKKKVERSQDGQITEIIYRGHHNHAMPHSSCRGSVTSNDEMSDISEANETCHRADADSAWGDIQLREKDGKHDPDWKLDGQERTNPPSSRTELSNPTKRFRSLGMYESDEAREHYSTLANHNGDKGGATQAVSRLEDDVEDAESKLKRRKKESYPGETMVPSRAVREPRVVVQIESEVDILDDGYRWRKYGQKVVKGNPNPRSYYKCTSDGCNVRKHVERASHDLKYVITTYEGKHNHEVPTARNNNQISSNNFALTSSGVNMQVSNISKFGTHQTLAPHFDRKSDFNNEFMRSSLMGSFSNDMKFGHSSASMFQMKYSSLNSIIPFGSYKPNLDHGVAPQAGPIDTRFPMPLPMNLPSSKIFSLSENIFNYGKPLNRIQAYLSGQNMNGIDTRFLRSRQVLKDESLYAACPNSLDHTSTSLTPPSPLIYQSVMQNFPA